MRKRFNVLAVAIVLAILSFAYARYDYADKHTATLTNPFNKNESKTFTDPFRDKSFLGDWMKDKVLFAIVLPVAFIAGGVVLAVRK